MVQALALTQTFRVESSIELSSRQSSGAKPKRLQKTPSKSELEQILHRRSSLHAEPNIPQQIDRDTSTSPSRHGPTEYETLLEIVKEQAHILGSLATHRQKDEQKYDHEQPVAGLKDIPSVEMDHHRHSPFPSLRDIAVSPIPRPASPDRTCQNCISHQAQLLATSQEIERLQQSVSQHQEAYRVSATLEHQNQQLSAKITELEDAATRQSEFLETVVQSCGKFESTLGTRDEQVRELGRRIEALHRAHARELGAQNSQIGRLEREIKQERFVSRKSRDIIEDWKRYLSLHAHHLSWRPLCVCVHSCLESLDEMGPVDFELEPIDGLLSRYMSKLKKEILDQACKIKHLEKERDRFKLARERYLVQLDRKDEDLKSVKLKLRDADDTADILRRERDSAAASGRDAAVALTRITEAAEYKYTQLERELRETVQSSSATIQKLRENEGDTLARAQRRAEELLAENSQLSISLSELKRRKGLFEYGLDGHLAPI